MFYIVFSRFFEYFSLVVMIQPQSTIFNQIQLWMCVVLVMLLQPDKLLYDIVAIVGLVRLATSSGRLSTGKARSSDEDRNCSNQCLVGGEHFQMFPARVPERSSNTLKMPCHQYPSMNVTI